MFRQPNGAHTGKQLNHCSLGFTDHTDPFAFLWEYVIRLPQEQDAERESVCLPAPSCGMLQGVEVTGGSGKPFLPVPFGLTLGTQYTM